MQFTFVCQWRNSFCPWIMYVCVYHYAIILDAHIGMCAKISWTEYSHPMIYTTTYYIEGTGSIDTFLVWRRERTKKQCLRWLDRSESQTSRYASEILLSKYRFVFRIDLLIRFIVFYVGIVRFVAINQTAVIKVRRNLPSYFLFKKFHVNQNITVL